MAAAGVLAASSAHAAPLAAYGGLPFIEMIELSPDGNRLALGLSTGGERLLAIKNLNDGATDNYPIGDAKLRRIDWFGSDHVIVTTSRTGLIPDLRAPRREYFLGFDLDLNANKLKPLLDFSTRGLPGTRIRSGDSGKVMGTLNTLVGSPEVRTINGTPTLYVPGISFPSNRGVLTIFRRNHRSDTLAIAALGSEDTNDFVLDEAGKPVAEALYDSEKERWALRLRQGGVLKEVYTVQAAVGEGPQLLGLGRDGRSVVVSELKDGEPVVREVSLDGVWSDPLDVADVDDAVFDPSTHRLIGIYAMSGDEARYTFFDPADQRAWNAVKAAYKGDSVRMVAWSDDRKRIVVLVDSVTEGPAYALVDLNTHRGDWIGPRYEKLDLADIAKVQPIGFKAADGTSLTGYLTVPNGVDPKGLPLIVLPHGGPAARDTREFDWWAQALASRGYAVLQVNFRGSAGFGIDFMRAGYGQWGRKMQIDLSDGVRHLTGLGLVDAKRVCIVGASYGGYAALAGVTLDADVYRCGVSVAGIADLRRFSSWLKTNNGRASARYFDRFIGAENSRDPTMTEVSPVAHLDRIAAPVLLIHGKDDTIVPLDQSQLMAEAMKKAGKSVELVVLQGEDHWLSTGETRLAMLQATVDFVEKHNPAH